MEKSHSGTPTDIKGQTVIIGIDTGGTFTDFIYKDDQGWGVYKLLSTPRDPSVAVLAGIVHIAKGRPVRVVHGSTVATNAILERKGAVTALVTNQGFEDVIEIGRQNRSELYNLTYRREPHIVPPELRFGVRGRVTSTGAEAEPFSEEAAREVARQISDSGAKSVAVCFLFSFLNPSHERRMREILAASGLPVSLSHEILAEFREFERTSTTVVNAYVSPLMQRYISRIACAIGDKNLSVMQSNGGRISAETSMREPVRTILSGPAGGAVGAFEVGRMAGYDRLITFDMGGTSTDVSLIDGALPLTVESRISSYPVKVPMIDIHTVGAGGGSIARIDSGGSLVVGPESAGADPGPICYGKGSEITVTDANLFLGRLIPDRFLGGAMKLVPERLDTHFRSLSKKAGLTPLELAEGICAVANTAMERAIRVISVERGHDPGEFTLFSFGGAGGMHAVYLARLLNIPRVLVPKDPGIMSAIGMLAADVVRDFSLTVMLTGETADADILNERFRALEELGYKNLADEGVRKEKVVLEHFLDMRYRGQSYEIIVPSGGDLVERFHQYHEKKYGYRNEGKTVEIVNLRLRARGLQEKPAPEKSGSPAWILADGAVLGVRNIVFESREHRSTVYERNLLRHGNRIEGPAVVVEYSATILLPPGTSGTVDAFGNLVIEVR